MDPILLLILMLIVLALPVWQTYRQNKQLRQIRDMQSRLFRGAEVVTGSGQHGVVVDLDDKTVDLEIAEGVVTRWERGAVIRNVSEDEAAAAKAAQPGEAGEAGETGKAGEVGKAANGDQD